MAATITKGHAYTIDADVTPANSKALVESATIEDISRTNIKNSVNHVFEQATAPPAGHAALEPWQHSTNLWLITKLTNGNPASLYPQGVLFVASGAVSEGDVLSPVDVTAGVPTMKKNESGVSGVAVCLMDAADGENSLMVFGGIVSVSVSGTVAQGDRVSVTPTGGQLLVSPNVGGDGTRGVAVSADVGGRAWVSLSR